MENEIITINQPQITVKNNLETMDLTTKYFMENLDKALIIFCNPISGNREGEIILDLADHYITKEKYKLIDFQYLVTAKKYEPIKSIYFDLLNKQDVAKGELLIRHCIEQCKVNEQMGLEEKFKKVKILIAGGDGSILTTVEHFEKNGIDLKYCSFGHIPLGTGNDLANSLGFSDHITISCRDIDQLYSILKKYYEAKFGNIDIWKMDLVLDSEEGEILFNSDKGKNKLKDENGNIIRRYIRKFINYLSLGYDARVGYNFDVRRTECRNTNKCIYFIEGFKKTFCRKTVRIPKFIDSLTVYEGNNDSNTRDHFLFKKNNNDYNNNENTTEANINLNNKNDINLISQSQNDGNNETQKEKIVVLEGNACSIVFQNIVNYMSGAKDIWGKSSGKISAQMENGTYLERENFNQKLELMGKAEQKMDDHKIEVFTFDNGLETGFEKIVGGFAKKIYHGKGPLDIKFCPTPKYNKEDRKNRIYLNIDGEYLHIIKPISLRIELNTDYINGQLNFLLSNKS